MPLEHDPVKAAANLKKHGVSFADAEGALFDPLALTIEDIGAVDEPRYVTIGLGSAGDLLVVIYTYRDGEPRLISARHATRRERRTYES
ncbi:MAG TPA: BrnT family toxin [Usitatibacter sp.]|nr:BrnT family toxin [Usitatibacter sp.]